MGMIQEFKEFAMKGSVVDLAVGVVIGGAFQGIVDSLVKDIIMPIVGILTGGYNFSTLSYKVGEAELKYGSFIQASLNFLIITLVLFVTIKGINKMRKEKTA